MVTILTETECIHVNLKTYSRELELMSVLKYHKKLKSTDTKKKIKISSDPPIEIYPSQVIDVSHEPRRYDPAIGNTIDELINQI